MALTKIRIGDYFELNAQACSIPNLTGWDISGVNREKEFFEPSTQVGADTSKYKIVPPQHFACNLMHVGRDKVLPIAFNHTKKDKIVSPAYFVFKIKENEQLLSEYFFIMLKSIERDRYFWFHTDGSIRDGMAWEDFCDLEIFVPSIYVQQEYVNVYNAIAANQKAYEKGLDDLKLVCDGFIEDLRHKLPCEKIGQYLEYHDIRNSDNKCKNVKGVTVYKNFRDPTSKVKRDELHGYKIVKPSWITFVQTTHNEKVFAYAFNNTTEDIVVSSVNEVFSTDKEKLLPQYLCMFFNRKEFDRYARFHSWGSARETFTWNDLVEVEIPIPNIKIQQSIVDIYNQCITRKEINEKLKAQIKDLCPILIKGSLEWGVRRNEE